jgi:hypothetical protein
MNPLWKKFRIECGQFAWTDGYMGDAKSTKCVSASKNLQANATIIGFDSVVKVSSTLTDSIIYGLFLNDVLNERK